MNFYNPQAEDNSTGRSECVKKERIGKMCVINVNFVAVLTEHTRDNGQVICELMIFERQSFIYKGYGTPI